MDGNRYDHLTMSPPINQDACCLLVRRVLSARVGLSIELTDSPDLRERNRRAVEQVWHAASSSYVVEHTRIEAFHGQIKDDHVFRSLIEPLEQELSGLVPLRVSLSVDVGAASDVRGDYSGVRREIGVWFREVAPALATNQRVHTTLLGVDLRVTLWRDAAGLTDGRVLVSRFSDLDVTSQRRKRLLIAVEAKCPKLNEAALEHDAHSVLILESNDVPFGNHVEIADALECALQGRTDCPNYVFLVETVEHPWVVWVLREHDERFPDISDVPEAGPHFLEELPPLSD